MRIQVILFLLACSVNFSIYGQIKLPALFTDNMVLQQQTDAAIWGWAKPGRKVTIKTSWNRGIYNTKADANGKWKLKVTTVDAGGPYEIEVSDGTPVVLRNVMLGEVWMCSGQSNMEMPMKGFKGEPVSGSNDVILKSTNRSIRLITIPRASEVTPQHDFKGQWQEASPTTVAEFSATAYYFARLVNDILEIPVGIVSVSYGGSNIEAWMEREWLEPFNINNFPSVKDSIRVPNRTPTVLFNGMLFPVIGYTIRGVLWYQGESNYTNPTLYEELFPVMVQEWRKKWGQGDFPFYYAQIAPFDYSSYTPNDTLTVPNSAYLREAQRKCQTKILNSGMAVLMDTGEKRSIHPARKKEAGERLAYWALAKTYGITGFGYASPEFEAVNIDRDKAVITFTNIPNGITSFGKDLTCFEIAGADKKFYPAVATLGRKSVTLTSPDVIAPVAVRYAFRNWVVGDLFSTEGLPVSSFRSDNWKLP